MLRFVVVLVTSLWAAQATAQDTSRERQQRLMVLERETVAQRASLEDLREERRLVEERIEAALLERELTPDQLELPPAKVRVRSSPVPAEVFLIPKAILDLRPEVRNSLKVRGAYYAGFVTDSTGLEATAKETSYHVIVRLCGKTEEREVSLFAARVVEVVIGVPCP